MVRLNGWKYPLTYFPIVSISDLGTCPNRRRGKDKIRKFWPQPNIGDLLTSDDLLMWCNCIVWCVIFRGLQNTQFEWWTAMTERLYAKLFQIKFHLLAKFASFFVGHTMQFSGWKWQKATRYGRLSPHFIIYIHRPITKNIWAFVPLGGTNFWKFGLSPMDYIRHSLYLYRGSHPRVTILK